MSKHGGAAQGFAMAALLIVGGLTPSVGCRQVRKAPAEPPPLQETTTPPLAGESVRAEGPSGEAAETGPSDASAAWLRELEPLVLSALEADGFTLPDMLARIDRAMGAPAGASWRQVKAAIARDVDEVTRSDPRAGVGVARYVHRTFDGRWLDDPEVRFQLVGVVPRLDRFAFQTSGCGELRLIYRMRYEKQVRGAPLMSRLPATLGLEFVVPREPDDPLCARVARRYVQAESQPGEVGSFTSEEGPLHPARLGFGEGQLRVVTNVQTVRWPSTVRPALGGHAEYALRTFVPEEGVGLRPAPLENTPDVPRLLADRALKERLARFLTDPETVARIDSGVVLVPDEFLAEKAVSVTPRGLARRANRPFSSVLTPADLAGVDWSSRVAVRSPEAALRRLDQLSCPGCHQARSVAGFHLLGEDTADTPTQNRIAVPLSAHSLEDDARRSLVLRAALSGEPLPQQQPFAERASVGSGGYGAHCTLGADPTYEGWTCEAGLRCTAYDEPPEEGIGICLPSGAGRAGDPCEFATITRDRDPRRDAVRGQSRRVCHASAVCNGNAVGFPGGMCAEECTDDGTTRCGAIAVLDPFNACLGRGEPFDRCLTTHVRPAGLRGCSAARPCRDDYLCAGSVEGGVCVPPYFVFQMRVDGHP